MALLQLWEDSFVEGRCPNCDDHVHSARSVRSGKIMPFDNPLMVVRTEALTSTTRAIAVVDGDASMCHLRSCRGRKGTDAPHSVCELPQVWNTSREFRCRRPRVFGGLWVVSQPRRGTSDRQTNLYVR